MLFPSIPFLYYFLPAVILVYFIAPKALKNTVLLIFSLIFYAWGEPKYIFLMIATVMVNYILGILIERYRGKALSKVFVTLSVVATLAVLGYFKYADFFIKNFSAVTGISVSALNIALPIGISFYTFQILSYTIDVYKGSAGVFPGTQGGPLMHTIAAKAVCFGEALRPEFKDYQAQLVKNAKVLSEALLEEGFHLVSGGTDNHLMLVDLRPFGLTGKEFEKRLDEVYITVNKNSIPDDPEKPTVTSGIRVGTPAVTTRGLKEEEMKTLAKLFKLAATDFENSADYIREKVTEICKKYPLYEG